MSEDRPIYLKLEQEINVLELLVSITADPAASHWLKRAVTELWERDTVDALNDLDVLAGSAGSQTPSTRTDSETHGNER